MRDPSLDEDYCDWCGGEIDGPPIRLGDKIFDRMQCVTEYRAKYCGGEAAARGDVDAAQQTRGLRIIPND